jgi:ATP-dependent Clp protease ATP-binding subunit ClpA
MAKPYLLQRYARELTGYESGTSLGALSQKGDTYVQELEDILLRERESNALLVGNPGEGVLDVISAFAKALHTGEVPLALEGRRAMMLDGEVLIITCGREDCI